MIRKVSTIFSTVVVGLLMIQSVKANDFKPLHHPALIYLVQREDSITLLGKWKGVEEPDRQIEFVQESDGSFSGKVINSKRSNPKNGTILLKNLKLEPQSKTFVGKMNPPDKDIELEARVSFEGDDKLKLEASKFFMTKTIHFLRIK